MPYIPKKTSNTIVESGNHYVIQVKKNANKLYESIKKCATNQEPIDRFEMQENAHERKTTAKSTLII